MDAKCKLDVSIVQDDAAARKVGAKRTKLFLFICSIFQIITTFCSDSLFGLQKDIVSRP